MTFFESLLVLLLTAIVLLQLSRHLLVPYPAMLAGAGVAFALFLRPLAIPMQPDTALALFMAPPIAYAAFGFSPRKAWTLWRPLVTLGFFAVVITTGLVAWIAWKLTGLPVAACVALGAIVSPPDAAAAIAVLSSVSIPQRTVTVLKGESLFNDATALLIFSTSLAILSHGAFTLAVSLAIALTIPGGILLGVGCALLLRCLIRFVKNTLGGNLLQFVATFLVWIVAEHLRVSAVLCTIAFAMTMARKGSLDGGTRMRVQSYAVWNSVVFSLNVLAFFLMGLQGRTIVAHMPSDHLKQSFGFAAVVVLAVVIVRLTVTLGVSRSYAWWERLHSRPEPVTWRQAVFVGWSGMRGFVTLASAFALPATFPRRDLVVLTAFSVVIATLVVQSLTFTPLIRLLKLNQADAIERDLADARNQLATAALTSLAEQTGPEIEHLRYAYAIRRDSTENLSEVHPLRKKRQAGLTAILAERRELDRLQKQDLIGTDTYLLLQEELDWNELTLLGDRERRIEES